MNAAEVFARVLAEKKNPKIKLIGDSITHGVGGSGWQQNGRPIVENFAESPDSYCWATMFRDYMKEKYGATVVNKACTGTRVEFVMKNFSELVEPDDDLIVCTIGTNNRHRYFAEVESKPERDAFLADLHDKIKSMYTMFTETGIPTIFVANIPASEANEQDGADYWRILHMDDINNAYRMLERETGATVLSMYEMFLNYCKENGRTVDDLLCDGLHPNDEGYRVMFDLFVGAFGV